MPLITTRLGLKKPDAASGDTRADLYNAVRDNADIAESGVAVHLVGTGSEPAFLNSWQQNGGGTNATVGFSAAPGGRVFLHGVVSRGASPLTNSIIFILPASYRPTATGPLGALRLGTVMRSDNGSGAAVISAADVYINAAGEVTYEFGPTGTGAVAWLTLEGLSFKV